MFTFSKNEIHTEKSSILEKERKHVLAHRNVNIHSDPYLQQNTKQKEKKKKKELWRGRRGKPAERNFCVPESSHKRPCQCSSVWAETYQWFKMRNSLFDMKEMGEWGGGEARRCIKCTVRCWRKYQWSYKMSRFIDNELFWFAVCTLSVYLWVILKIRNHFLQWANTRFNF